MVRLALPGFHCDKPLITTGAGDHLMLVFLVPCWPVVDYLDALSIGGASSGHYVRTAESPSRQQLVKFLRDWPASQQSSASA